MKKTGEGYMQEDKWDTSDVPEPRPAVETGVRIRGDELRGLVESKEIIVSSI